MPVTWPCASSCNCNSSSPIPFAVPASPVFFCRLSLAATLIQLGPQMVLRDWKWNKTVQTLD